MAGEIQYSDLVDFVEKNSDTNSVSVDQNGVTANAVDADSVTGKSIDAGRVSSKNQNNTINAMRCSGANLKQKVEDAVSQLSNLQGKIRISPQDDGAPLQWGEQFDLNPNDYNGIEIEVDEGTEIEYSGDGWFFNIASGGDDLTGGQLQGANVSIRGGNWRATGSDPAGWARLEDVYRVILEPRNVFDLRNTTDDSTWIEVNNVTTWSESMYISGRASNVDKGIVFQDAEDNGDPDGPPSFQDLHIHNTSVSAHNVGYHFSGNFVGSKIDKAVVFLRSDNAVGYLLETDAKNAVFEALEVEEGGSGATGTVGFKTGENFHICPLLINPNVGSDVETPFERTSASDRLPALTSDINSIYFENLGENKMQYNLATNRMRLIDSSGTTTMEIDDEKVNAGFEAFNTGVDPRFNDGIQLAESDLSTITGNRLNHVMMHDGADGSPKDIYFWTGSNWQRVGDSATTI